MVFVNDSVQSEFHKGGMIPIVVQKGNKIKLRHYSSFETITDVIGNIQGNNILMNLPKKLLENSILVGDNIVCIYYDAGMEYVMTGRVENITLLYPQQITIRVENVEKFDNQRKHTRYSVSLSANITKPVENETYFAVVKNVSIVGASLTCKDEVQPNTEVLVDIAVSQNNVISYYGKIIRARQLSNFFEYGIIQTKIDDVNYRELVKYIQKLEDEEDTMFSGRQE